MISRSSARVRETSSFNQGWRFARFGSMPDGTVRDEPEDLEKAGFDDTEWREVTVPHDWGIEGPFRADLPGNIGKLPWAGIGWYRKSFLSPEPDQGRHVFLDFDGAMSGATVWLNGQCLGERPYGYASFRMRLDEHLRPGQENTVAVRLDNKASSSRWYAGGGIYRNVRLVKTGAVHVAHWGISVTTPKVSPQTATIEIQTWLEGKTEGVRVRHEIHTEDAKRVKVGDQTVSPGTLCTIKIPSPRLWNLDTPNLYTVWTTVLKDGHPVDDCESVFGIRTLEYHGERGFLLNSKAVRLNGVCQHHDLGPLGAAVNTRALERQIEILQEMGCNAIRTAHNPPAPELLDLCDRMGMLVQVEAFDTWAMAKAPNDYALLFDTWHDKDLRTMVRRDRNHPCVIMWSIGNEILEFGHPEKAPLSQRLADVVRAEDPTRPVTFGGNIPEAGFNGFQETVDVFGYNYKPHLYEAFHKAHPDRPLYGSETASTLSSRGEYFFPVSDDQSRGNGGHFQVSSYDLSAPPWGSCADVEFQAQDRCPWVFGEFVWSGFDYLGEPTPYNDDKTNLLNLFDPEAREVMKKKLDALGNRSPSRSSYFGIVDLCGFPKDRFYLYQARWRADLPSAHILPHWNWPERTGLVTPVHVYTSGDEAELFINGKSLGRRKKGPFEYRLRWDDVVYEPGELQVEAYRNGKPWATGRMKTTGVAARLELSADRGCIAADGTDLSFVTVRVKDGDGLLVPRTHHFVTYALTGPGEILAVGNGDPTNHEPFQARSRKVFNGMALVVVRSRHNQQGEVTLVADSEGLSSATATIVTRNVAP